MKPPEQEVIKQSRAGVGRARFSGDSFRKPFGDSRSLVLVPLCDPLPVTVGWRERPLPEERMQWRRWEVPFELSPGP